jgi:hypothetical protein
MKGRRSTEDAVRNPSPQAVAAALRGLETDSAQGENPVPEPTDSAAELQQKYRQFLDLLPLTLALAGLPTSEGRLFSEDQMEGRGMTVKMAYRVARTVAKECLGGS